MPNQRVSNDPEGLNPVLDMARDLDATLVNIIGQVMPSQCRKQPM